MPLYSGLPWDELARLDGSLQVPMYHGLAQAGVRTSVLPGSDVPIYFIEHHRFFDRPHLYGPPGEAYDDNLERFAFFSRASLQLCTALGFTPDVVHAHDWQTALVPAYLNTVQWGTALHNCASVMTIHNLAYQGVYGRNSMFLTGLGHEHFTHREFEHFGDVNLLKAGLVHSTVISTVSPSYCQEVQTQAWGCGLNGVLAQRREHFHGILNGIDTEEWDPRTDQHLQHNFGPGDWQGKAANKAALQAQLGLPVRADIPLFGVVGRLTHQKGFDVLARSLAPLLNGSAQVVLLGSGDRDAEHYFGQLSHQSGANFHAHIGFDNQLAHRIEAASDFFIMPSRFEPCGLNQLYSMRYGTLPIVRRIGGLADTVDNYNVDAGTGTGFVFNDLTQQALVDTFHWVLDTYENHPQDIAAMRLRGMNADWSWEHAAGQYQQLYETALALRGRS